jgi:hypothetical protein
VNDPVECSVLLLYAADEGDDRRPNLDEAAKDMRLDFFILFSSLAGGMGNLGQAGYA